MTIIKENLNIPYTYTKLENGLYVLGGSHAFYCNLRNTIHAKSFRRMCLYERKKDS